MIQSFSDRDTETLFQTETHCPFAAIARVALRKLIQLNQAGRHDNLTVPPGNRLELLKGRLAGYHSIRFGVFFEQSDTFWHSIQVECDFRSFAHRT